MKLWSALALSVLVFFSISSAYAVSALITDYQQLVKVLEQGDNVKAIVHFERCLNSNHLLQTEFAQNLAGSSTRFNFTHYLHFNARIDGQLKDTVVTTEHSSLVDTNSQLANIFGRLEVYDDNTALVRVDYFDADPIQQLLTLQWTCEISNGRDDKGLYLYSGW